MYVWLKHGRLTFALSRAAQRHLTTDRKPRRLQRKLDADYFLVSVFRMKTHAIGRPDMTVVAGQPPAAHTAQTLTPLHRPPSESIRGT